MYWVPAAGLPEDRVNIDLGDDGIDESDVFDARAILEWSLPSDYTLTSLTGYKKFGFHYLEDYDGGPDAGQRLPPDQRRRVLEPGIPPQFAG